MREQLVLAVVLAALAPGVAAQIPTPVSEVSVTHFVAPVYPLAAWLARVQGPVSAKVTINQDGTVKSVDSVAGFPLLLATLKDSLGQWKFKPVSSETAVTVVVDFRVVDDCPQLGIKEPTNNYFIYTQVSADLPSNIEVRICPPIVMVDSSKTAEKK